MQKNNIKTIFFDVGDVLAKEGFKKGIKAYEEKHHTPNGELYAAMHDHSYWKDFTFGKIDIKTYYNFVKNNFSGELDTNELDKFILESFSPNTELINYLPELKNKYKLGIISNNPKEWFDYFFKYFGFDSMMEVKAVAGYLGLRKPSTEIFEYALKEADVLPSESVYVDDRAEMTEEAKALGMNIIVYSDFESFVKELNEITSNER